MVEGEKVGLGSSFPNLGCGFEGIWKIGHSQDEAPSVSHDSHRELKKACAKGIVYVKSVSGAAWSKGLKETSNAQRAGF
jgi:hypothetical protein